MVPPPSVTTLGQFSSRSPVAHRLPPRKKFRSTTTDDVLNQLAREAIDILSHHPLAPTSPRSSSQLPLDAPESPDSFFKRAGIQISTPLHLRSRSLTSRKRLEPPPPPLPRPCPSDCKRPNLHSSPSAQPAYRRLTPSEPPHTSLLLLTPSTARAAQSLLELTQ